MSNLTLIDQASKKLAERETMKAAGPTVRSLAFEFADDLPDTNEDFDDELIEGVVGRLAMAVLYGDSNSGKTFLAIDMAAALCRVKDWHGRPVAGGAVLYLATEAAESVRLRLRAYRRFHRTCLPGLVIVPSPINLFDGEADVSAVLMLVSKIESMLGDKVVLVIGDTLARISAGANENSGEDMGVVLRHADAIRAATGGDVPLDSSLRQGSSSRHARLVRHACCDRHRDRGDS